MSIRIARLGSAAPILLAAQELRDYFLRMDPGADVVVLCAPAYDPARANALWVGEDAAFAPLLPAVAERSLDDGIYLDVRSGRGIVTGTNPRSVLLAAYRLLRENGCAFLRPGTQGEIIPARALATLAARVCEAASSRHRGVCIEGAVSCEHVKNMIRFLPKIGMNAYFIQFFVPHTFFDRWYAHAYNARYAADPISREEVAQLSSCLVEEIKQRGLMYHAVGHGWTCEPFGIVGDTWDERTYDVPPEVRDLLAEVNGERALWHGVPLNTNLCYGNAAVRARVTEAIAAHCAAHPQIDYLHFWLADGANNHCECPLCRDTLPADFYVMMLNELDEKLTARAIPTRIVFLIYVDLLWPPAREVILHPERFVLMFAPITRTYTTPFLPDEAPARDLAPYARNRNAMPASVAENVARLRSWQARFAGDGFDFDYHFMWDHLKDSGYYEMARILMEDMKNLEGIGLRGMISCQNQRVFFPNALGMHAMAEALWDREAAFDPLVARYFARQYGPDGEAAAAYLRELSARMDPPYLRLEKERQSPAQAARYRTVMPLVAAFLPTIKKNLAAGHAPCVHRAWRALELHAELVLRMARTFERSAAGDAAGARAAWADAAAYAREIEREVHEDFDVFEFLGAIGRVVEQLCAQ